MLFMLCNKHFHTNNCEGSKPESTATSFFSRPLEMNLAVIFSRGSKGDGKLFASLSLAAVPSLRPRGTAQNGPLLWKKNTKILSNNM